MLPTSPIAALRKSFQTIGFFFSPAFQPRLQILREALAFLKEEIAWKLVDINYLQASAVTAIALKTCSLNHPGEHTCCWQIPQHFFMGGFTLNRSLRRVDCGGRGSAAGGPEAFTAESCLSKPPSPSLLPVPPNGHL